MDDTKVGTELYQQSIAFPLRQGVNMQATLKQTSTVPAPVSDQARLADLRARAKSTPDAAKEATWDFLKELQDSSQFYRLPMLFAEGNGEAEAPNGDTEGPKTALTGK